MTDPQEEMTPEQVEIARLTLERNQAVAVLNQITTVAEVVPGPDGRPRMAVLLQVGGLAAQIQMDLESAPGFAAHVHKMITDKYNEAKRAASGLVVADASQLPKLGPLPGAG